MHYSAEELLPCVKAMGAQAPPLLPRYRVRVLEGNHLAGTEHRIFELRRFRAAALPGQALGFYDPRFDLMTDVSPARMLTPKSGRCWTGRWPAFRPAIASWRTAISAGRGFCSACVAGGLFWGFGSTPPRFPAGCRGSADGGARMAEGETSTKKRFV